MLVGLWVHKLVEDLVNERKVGGLSFQRKGRSGEERHCWLVLVGER